jgi:L-amino acid N-acyltransferase
MGIRNTFIKGAYMLTIRQAVVTDLAAITEIYNDAILTTTATFDTEPKTGEEQATWFKNHNSRNPVIVAETDNIVVGWASLSKWSDRCAYSDTAEISVYVRNGYRGQGIGKKLMKAIILKGKEAGLHTIIARIVAGNKESLHLHEDMGFDHIGVMKEVGKKFGKLLDVHMMQLIFPTNPE